MRRECYSLQPPRIELYTVFSGTDIILRKNITETEKEEPEKYTAWECDEVQFHYRGEATIEEIEADYAITASMVETKKKLMRESFPLPTAENGGEKEHG